MVLEVNMNMKYLIPLRNILHISVENLLMQLNKKVLLIYISIITKMSNSISIREPDEAEIKDTTLMLNNNKSSGIDSNNFKVYSQRNSSTFSLHN